ncbi:hypothetical protein [Paracoccus rhizosphaerae]|uniref:Uncharacterized protein n=1 Tax=Paracoccus rhizosphaerae TaxID=1133347 RepID=A0ABV6CJW2_9RHOB|nr:hypothetical protein [Paracoccus rhizosphaerae]
MLVQFVEVITTGKKGNALADLTRQERQLEGQYRRKVVVHVVVDDSAAAARLHVQRDGICREFRQPQRDGDVRSLDGTTLDITALDVNVERGKINSHCTILPLLGSRNETLNRTDRNPITGSFKPT